MKTILIATDFSDASRNASFYGCKLAKELSYKVVLLNVYPDVVPQAGVSIMIANEELESNSNEALHSEEKWLSLNGTVEIEKRSVQGNALDVILSVARQVRASWIVAGMKGHSKISRKIFGGTSYALSRNSSIPLILVPEGSWFLTPQVIALASDINEETDLKILNPLKTFFETFNTKMYVVRVIKKGMNDVFERLIGPARLQWHLKEMHPSYEFLNDDDVAHAMNKFVKEHKVDMVAMISQDHNLFERIFLKSNIKEMIFYTQVPLLILPGKVNGATSVKSVRLTEQGVA